MNWTKELSTPYIVEASKNLLNLFENINTGITATAPGFYGPQGRQLRIPFNKSIRRKNAKF